MTESQKPSTHGTQGLPACVLITPARNEAELIESTIQSVVQQTLRPLKWVIVSDGSTDGTDDIVKKYSAEHPWIELVRRPERRERDFAGKVKAFNAGFERARDLPYDVIGNLDADITFEPDYLAFLLGKFAENPRLGVAGTPFRQGTQQYDYRFVSIEHVSGACQLFRRECFADIGGYQPVASGGIDLIAVLSARMKGWETRSFPEMVCFHHRKMGAAAHEGLRERYHRGRMDYLLGSHPVWETFRSIYQMRHRPYLVGGVLILLGYWGTMLSRRPRTMPRDVMQFRRREQLSRLRRVLRRELIPGN